MKTITINCDICGNEMNTEGVPLKFEGYTLNNEYGLLFDSVAHCCQDCRQKIVDKLRKAYEDEVKEIINAGNN